MKRLTFYPVLIYLLALTATSCDKKDDLEVKEATAILHWSGDYDVDGCGFSIALNKKVYKPDNEQDIGSAYKKYEPTTVKLKYALPGKMLRYNCGLSHNEAESILVLSVKALN
jgi:hypothetical protein